MKFETTWAVVADAGRARIFGQTSLHGPFVELRDQEIVTEHPKSGDIYADRPGRSHESVGPGRHAMEPTSDAHRLRKKAAARAVAQMLLKNLNAKHFEKLVVIAAPIFLGDLRQEMAHRVQAVIRAEFPKDIANVPSHDLSQKISDLLAWPRPS